MYKSIYCIYIHAHNASNLIHLYIDRYLTTKLAYTALYLICFHLMIN